MSAVFEDEPTIAWTEIIAEALRGIKSELLLYALAVAAILVGSAYLGIDVLRELKWPLIMIFSAGLLAYFFSRSMPEAKKRLLRQKKA